jgi:hypothetical protein
LLCDHEAPTVTPMLAYALAKMPFAETDTVEVTLALFV